MPTRRGLQGGRAASAIRRHGRTAPWWPVAVVGFVGFALAVVAYAGWHAFSSDDVAIQNIIRSVQSGRPLQPAVGNDNFLLKVPIYLLTGLLPAGTATLVLTVLLCNVPLVAALLVIGRRQLAGASRRRVVVGGLLLCWFLVSQLGVAAPTIQPNGRNGEVGLALLLLWWRLAAPEVALTSRAVLGSVVSVAGFALLCFSDLFFLFVMVPAAAGLLATTLLTGAGRRRSGVLLAEFTVGGALAWLLISVAKSAGFVISQNFVSVTPRPGQLPEFLSATFGAVARDFNADVWSRPLSVDAAPAMLQLALTALVVALAALAVVRRRGALDLWSAALTWTVVVNAALFVLTSNAADDLSFRYVFLAAMALLLLALRGLVVPPGAPRSLLSLRARRAIAMLAVAATVYGLFVNVASIVRSRDAPSPSARTEQIIAIARDFGATTGVGAYWDANLATWYSGGSVHVVPQTCSGGHIDPYPWLVNLPEMSRTSARGFVVLSAGSGCTAAAAQARFGTPDRRAALTAGGDQIWLYNRPVTP